MILFLLCHVSDWICFSHAGYGHTNPSLSVATPRLTHLFMLQGLLEEATEYLVEMGEERMNKVGSSIDRPAVVDGYIRTTNL